MPISFNIFVFCLIRYPYDGHGLVDILTSPVHNDYNVSIVRTPETLTDDETFHLSSPGQRGSNMILNGG
ncbi:unnamed protein product [Parnassius mnemosyne]|uniref:Uncharacterized protein n=1 Tax=Parnassius mnemosyne TaxID=213953 RepID=A0AAV1KK09_9NEOP